MYPNCSTLSRLNPKFLNTEGPYYVSLAANFVFNCVLENMSVSVFCGFFCVSTVLHEDRKTKTLRIMYVQYMHTLFCSVGLCLYTKLQVYIRRELGRFN